MKKIILSLVFFLTMVMGSYGQVAYDYDWEATAIPMGGWTTGTSYIFSRNTILPCDGLASARANTYSGNTSTLTSPMIPNSNGGLVTLVFDYKVTLYSSNTTGAPATQVDIEIQTSNSASGPWVAVDYINENNHTVSASCAAKTSTFSALPGNFYVRFVTKSINAGDVYYYFDNVSITQGEAPSCIPPAVITASDITSNSVNLTWDAASTVPSAGYEYYYSTSNVAPAAGTATTGLTASLTGLMDNTVYYVWVRSMCESGASAWNGPVNFTTLCVPFGDFTENFNTSTAGTGLVPNCWKKLVVSTAASANVSIVSYTASSTPNAIYMTNSSDTAAQIFLITPGLEAIGDDTHRMKFNARGGSAGQILSVGTMSDPDDASTYVELQSYTLTTTYSTYNVTLNTSTTAGYVAFKHGLGGTYRSVYLDDVIWEPIPTEAPGCIEDMNTVINEGCGNFPTTFSWATVPGADGYKVSIGTSMNGQDLVVDEADIYTALNYSFVGNPGTMYYYTIRPYNAFGDAVDCYEDNFTTYDDGCYCTSTPTSNEGAGITSVQINDVITPVTDVTYANFANDGAIDITQGVSTTMYVTYATGATYFTSIWIDYNDNYTFETSELVFTGESTAVNPTTLTTAFTPALTAALGEHRMRIGATNYVQTPLNPCYSSYSGITLDFLVNVVAAPDCLPPTETSISNITADGAQLSWVSTGTLFNVETVFAGESPGSGTLTSGVTANTLTVTGLDAQTDYGYYLQNDCGDGSVSPWTGPYAFTTACASFGSFTENFTTDVTYSSPECWYYLKSTALATSSAAVNIYNYTDYAQFSLSNDANAKLYLITPSLTDLPLNTHRIKFKSYSSTAGAAVIVGTMSDPADESTFTAVQTIPVTSAFATYAVNFANSTTDSHVAFKFVGTATYQTLFVDDVVWEEAPACPDVYVVSFDGSTAYTADISWTAGGTETAWQYAYATSDITSPTGLTTYDVTTTPSATITGLLPSTNYNVWVRSSCGEGFGQWSAAKVFLTACIGVNTFPWTEGFESTTGTAFPPCWFKENGDWVTSVTNNYVHPRTGERYLRDSYYATNEYMWTPGFDLTAGVSYDFSFYMAGDGYEGWAVDVFHNTVQNSTGATQIGTTVNASGAGTIYALQPYAKVTNTFVPTTTGTYYFAVRVNQPASPWYIGFDDFRMEPTPTCIAPNAPTATDIEITTATLNWVETTPAPANGYEYYVTSDLTMTPNATTVATGSVAAGVTTAELTDLVGSTVYHIYVRSICGTDDYSSWSDAGNMITNCVNAILPYTINFDSAAVPALPLCTTAENVGTGNIWTTATSPGYGFSSNVLRYAYSFSGAADTWFYTSKVSLVAGTTYSISYDYGSNSTSYNERMKISYGSTANATAMTNLIIDHPTINFNVAQSNTATFSPTVSGDYVIGLNAYSILGQYYLYVDNIVIQEVLSSGSFDNQSFTAYPNPVKDMLNLSFTQNITDVAVYNLLGQQVLLTNMNANKGQVDMSSLTSGTYLVKVNTENGVKTIKVIKE